MWIPDRDGNFYLEENYLEERIQKPLTVEMILYTRFNKNEKEGQHIENLKFANSFFNSSNPTRILIHGWFNDKNSDFGQSIKDAFLKIRDYNVILADWSSASKNLNYLDSK